MTFDALLIPTDGTDPAEAATRRGFDLAARLDVVAAVRGGIPAGEISDGADENDADAIVMGTRGRGGFERLGAGSGTDKVVRTASVPAAVLQPNSATTDSRSNEDDVRH